MTSWLCVVVVVVEVILARSNFVVWNCVRVFRVWLISRDIKFSKAAKIFFQHSIVTNFFIVIDFVMLSNVCYISLVLYDFVSFLYTLRTCFWFCRASIPPFLELLNLSYDIKDSKNSSIQEIEDLSIQIFDG